MKKVLAIVVKVIIAIGLMFALGGGSIVTEPLETLAIFALCYGLGTLYIWHFTSHDIFVGAGSPMSHVWALIVNLCIPLLIVVVPVLVLNMIPVVGTALSGIIILVLCVVSLLLDVLYIVRLFKPDFLAGIPDFSKKKDDAGVK